MTQPLPGNSKIIFDDGPYDQWAGRGSKDDTAYYIRQPGDAFLRPWLAVPDGIAFLWPLGLEGFSLTIDPTLGIHKYIGDNHVKVDVIHKGEEHITMTGSFPGDTGPNAMQALYNVVYADTPPGGKVLYLPHALDYTRRVTVVNARFDHSEDLRGTDLTYSIEFVISDLGNKVANQVITDDDVTSQGGVAQNTGTSTRRFTVTSKYNTLRKIAALKKVKWDSIYNKNSSYFQKIAVAKYKAPDYRLKVGVKLYY
jgi:hypothetical protein